MTCLNLPGNSPVYPNRVTPTRRMWSSTRRTPGMFLGRDNERPLFLFGQIRGPQMHHTVLDGHVRGRNLGPSLRLQLGQQLFPDATIIGLGAARGLVDRHRERLHEVRTADDSDELPVAHDGDTLDPVRL